MDTHGKAVVPIEYDNIGKFGIYGTYWALVQKGDKFGFIDTHGKVVVPIKYDNQDKIKIENH
ncbi:WG repeat-containing protein [Belliella marina]|uniref:WG repeat-containing protein n=1 Tax=Belliella marina TaxID=1644146 RepID=A0ABW4VPH2_9BACT